MDSIHKTEMFFLILIFLIACETKPKYEIVSNQDTTSIIFRKPYKKYSFVDRKRYHLHERTLLYIKETLNKKLYLYVYEPIFFQGDVLRNAQMILLDIDKANIVKKIYMPRSKRDVHQKMELYKNNIILASVDQTYVVRKDLGKMYNVGHYLQNVVHKPYFFPIHYYLKGDSIYIRKASEYAIDDNFKQWSANDADYIACPLY